MRVLRGLFACLVVLASALAPAYATPPVFHGVSIEPQPRVNPQSGANLVFFGDSITYGYGINNQTPLGCSNYTFPSPCYADQVTSQYSGTTEVNFGLAGSCLESTTTPGSACASGGPTPGITRYTSTILPYAGNNKNWFFILYGTNDIYQNIVNNDTQINVVTYKANLQTIVSALVSAGTPAGQIVLGEVPYGDPTQTNTSLLFAFNSAIAEVAQQYGTLLADTYRASAQCPSTCMYDGLHPNNTGHANLATEFESATYSKAYAAQSGYFLNALFASTNYVAAQTSAGIVSNAAASSTTPVGVNANGKGSTGTASSAPNPALMYFRSAPNAWGSFLWNDGTTFEGGNFEPTTYDGWAWLTFPIGTWPSTQGGFTRVARIDASGRFYSNGISANINNSTNVNNQAPNPIVDVYSGSGNRYGMTVYQDGTDFSTGFTQSASREGWYFITYPEGAYPALQSGFTKAARITAGGMAYLNGVNGNYANSLNTNSAAPNPSVNVYNSSGNQFGMTLYNDGTDFATGFTATRQGWYWLTYPNGSYPTLQSGFTQAARIDQNGNFWAKGTVGWGGSSGPNITSGSGAPVSACTAGAIYTRTDSSAAAGSEMYVCRNVSGTGTWFAVSGG